jgi:hypothetical protein
MDAQIIDFDIDEKGTVHPREGAPFDGEPVLIKLAAGWCEARWDNDIVKSTVPDSYGEVLSGFDWVCMDGDFEAEWDEPTYWAPLPKKAGGE